MSVKEEKPILIYVGDPMCSWCYGISAELSKTLDYYGDRVDFEIVMGGLRSSGDEEWNESFKSFLRQHWEDVGIKSGQSFSFDLLERSAFDYNTEPACRAVVTVESMASDRVFLFFKAVQKGFYLESNDPKQVMFYKPICETMGIDFDEFSEKFDSKEMKQLTQSHFQKSSQLGAKSFPTLLLAYKGQKQVVAIGYSTFEEMKSRINQVLK